MANQLKILTWNCNGAFRRKYNAIAKLDADIYIIQECEDPQTTNDNGYKEWGKNYLWNGENKNKGLGIFAKTGIAIIDLKWETFDLKYFISCRVNNSFNLLATWCHVSAIKKHSYIGQLWQYLQLHQLKLGNSIIAGDFNSNVFWDKKGRSWNHSEVVKELAALQIESIYHKIYNEPQGKESQPTLYLLKNRNKPYHIDYIFGSNNFTENIKAIEVGKAEDWLSISDYMPIMATIQL